MIKQLCVSLLVVLFCANTKAQVEPLILYKATQDPRCQQWVDSIFNKMSLKEKVGQLFIYTIAPVDTKANMSLLRDAVHNHKVGGLLYSKGELETQAIINNRAQEMAKTPLMITFDGEWGLSMRLKDTPVYSRNMVLGCVSDEQLIYEYGKEVARQCRELGIHVNFAPDADININPRNPVINTRSFGEDPVNVSDKVILYSSGLESGGVLSVPKHFPGHGDTETDSHHALPLLNFTRQRLDSIELYPFKQAIRAGLGGMMVGHLEVPVLEPQKGLPSSLSHNVVQKLLKDELGFKGLTFTDALAMKGVAGVKHVSLAAIKAGNDMVLTPRNLKEEIEAVIDAVKDGELSEEDINRKCKKILTYKYALGLANYKKIQISGLSYRINTPYARDLNNRLNEAAVTVANNKNQILPLHSDVKKIALINVGSAGGNTNFEQALKKHVGVKRIQLKPQVMAAERKILRDTLSNYKRVVVCISEKQLAPYKEFFSELSPEIPVIYVFFTPEKPMVQLEDGLSKASSVVLAHSNDKNIQEHVAKILFGEASVSGRLSTSVGNVFRPGDGVSMTLPTVHHFIPEEYGVKSSILNRIDAIAQEGIKEGAYPGCQVVVLKEGKTVYDKAFGTFSGEGSEKVTPTSIFDIASLSKTSGTLLAIMKLYDKGLFNLSDKVSTYLDFLKGTDKKDITIRELLLHESGLPSSIFFYLQAIDKDSYEGRLFKATRDNLHTVQTGAQTFAQPNYKFRNGLISDKPDNTYTIQVSDNFWLNKSFNDSINEGIIRAKLGAKTYRYSCIGFVLLQKLAEQLSGMPMNEFLAREFYISMGLQRTTYQPLNTFNKEEIVPSSIDNFLRKTTVQGFVHDETAAFQGGISGNAGIFSTAEEIALIHQMILNGGELDGKRYLSRETCKVFTTEKSRTSRRGLGFDKPDMKDSRKNPCAKSAPAFVYGHTGFTGTCAWVDPRNKLVYVFLSNRIYPDVWVNKLAKLQIRERIQDTIYESIK